VAYRNKNHEFWRVYHGWPRSRCNQEGSVLKEGKGREEEMAAM
jgi:hypothetical protein